ncbi:hypothetical protein LX64_02368 [Chitinophaga skermanii]|uniref:Uncharacterized protein n=2 Tax=Chitinophaga skermanii TaxID=331697 RepID=A0A327QNE4_9BACT|nr:hypothetical protein LX64_02368 [Chitinophaga skermanii]
MPPNWQLPIDDTYLAIYNDDSIQYVSEDESIIIFISIIKGAENTNHILTNTPPSIAFSEDSWLLKGTKTGGQEILVCVISFSKESDTQMVKELFASIVYIGN